MNEMNPNAVSVYNQDAMDDFPVLKAFQQYIDAEQAKARKRLVTLGIFFGALMFVVIAVFSLMLLRVSNRNQELNDKLVDFAMKDRDRHSPVVVQTPQQDNAAIASLSAKMDEMQRKLAESQAEAKRLAAEKDEQSAAMEASQRAAAKANAAAQAAKEKAALADRLEIQRLKAQLAKEKKDLEEAKAKQREAELEAYRRKHYPELYAPKPSSPSRSKIILEDEPDDTDDESLDDEIDDILNDTKAVSYFEDTDEKPKRKTRKKTVKPTEETPKSEFKIPVDVRTGSTKWGIPEE